MTETIEKSRLITKTEAAARCNITIDGFSNWVRKKIVPGPLPGTRRWDRIALEKALDRLSGLDQGADHEDEDPFKKWRERREHRKNSRRQNGSSDPG